MVQSSSAAFKGWLRKIDLSEIMLSGEVEADSLIVILKKCWTDAVGFSENNKKSSVERSDKSKLSEEETKGIRLELVKQNKKHVSLASELGVHPSTLAAYLNRYSAVPTKRYEQIKKILHL